MVVAPDKLRGSATAADVVAVVGDAVRAAGGTVEAIPMADGGEGTLDALGGPNRTSVVTGPLGDDVTAPWRLEGGTATIEMARASGLALVGGPDGNDPVAASTYGTGELVLEAVERGARRVIVAVGGSATTDGGLGALRAMYPVQRFRGIELLVACDVALTFVEAAEVFAPQKGATPAQVRLLRRRLERLADDYEAEYGVDVRGLAGAGAAGGLAGGLAAIGAQLQSGFELVADEVQLYERMEGADLVVTAEGFLDRESFDGKVVGGVASYAADLGIPVLAIAGRVFHDEIVDGVASLGGTFTAVSLVERFGEERSLTDATGCIAEVVVDHLAASS